MVRKSQEATIKIQEFVMKNAKLTEENNKMK